MRSEGNNPLEDLDVGGRKVLKRIFKKQEGEAGLDCSGRGGGLL